MNVVLDDRLHAEAHMDRRRDDEQGHQRGHHRRAEHRDDLGKRPPDGRHQDADEEDHQDRVRRAGDALAPEMLRCRHGRRRDGGRGRAACACSSRPPAPTAHTTTVSTTEPTILASARSVARRLVEADAEIPEEVADAAEHVVDQRPSVAEQHDQPEPRAEHGIGEAERRPVRWPPPPATRRAGSCRNRAPRRSRDGRSTSPW